jgi:cbb3-type cytochrome oxidase subunit 3
MFVYVHTHIHDDMVKIDAFLIGTIFILTSAFFWGFWICCDYYYFRPIRNNRIINDNANNEIDVVVEIPPSYDITITMPYYDDAGNEIPPPPAY